MKNGAAVWRGIAAPQNGMYAARTTGAVVGNTTAAVGRGIAAVWNGAAATGKRRCSDLESLKHD